MLSPLRSTIISVSQVLTPMFSKHEERKKKNRGELRWRFLGYINHCSFLIPIVFSVLPPCIK